jgi:anti-anti-sigma regulatory factor
MIWNVRFFREITVPLPVTFNVSTMYPFIDKAIDEQCDAKCSKVIFDFSKLAWIEPVGVVVLSNLIEYFRKIGVKVSFKGHTVNSQANIFLDDSGFFNHYLKKYIFRGCSR